MDTPASRPPSQGTPPPLLPPRSRSRPSWMYVLTLLIAVLGLAVVAFSRNAAEAWRPFESDIIIQLRHSFVMAGRLLLAMGLTLTIGLERQRRHKPAGMRTVAMVGIGACSFALLSSQISGGDPNAVSRMIQGIVTGIGFLGAGTIIKEQFHIEGLTTAATLWTVAGIGLAAGLGQYELTILTTIAAFVVLQILGTLERSLPGLRAAQPPQKQPPHQDEMN